MVFKKHLTPIGKGPVTVHRGKGSAPFPPQPKPGPLTAAAPSMNNYAKATPLPMPPPAPMGAMGSAPMDSGLAPGPGAKQGMV